MEDSKLHYLAGMVDADGSIIFTLVDTKIRLRLYVYNTYEPLMQWLESEFGGRYISLPTRETRHKPEFQWYLDSTNAYKLLLELLPFLIVKKERALVATEGWENRQPTPRHLRKQPVREDVLATRREYVRKFKELNKTGVRLPRKD